MVQLATDLVNNGLLSRSRHQSNASCNFEGATPQILWQGHKWLSLSLSCSCNCLFVGQVMSDVPSPQFGWVFMARPQVLAKGMTPEDGASSEEQCWVLSSGGTGNSVPAQRKTRESHGL